MELRQLRYFVAVAEEMHFGRAAARLHISGPALSQQIVVLERDLGATLFVRDRRGVRLTPAGHTLLDDARHLLRLADDARARLRSSAAHGSPLRLGHVSWVPPDVRHAVGPTVDLLVDEWLLPSHAQAERVAEGTLDVAIARVDADDAATRGLHAHLLFAEPLHALAPGTADGPLPARRVLALTGADESAWASWNRFAEDFADGPGARTLAVDDGGIAGEAFHDHVRRIGSAVLASPKRHTAVVPPTMTRHAIAPTPLWTWSLLHRAADDRPAVAQLTAALVDLAAGRRWRDPPASPWWVPPGDPHREVLAPTTPAKNP